MTTGPDVHDDELRGLLALADPWSAPDLDDVIAPVVAREASPAALSTVVPIRRARVPRHGLAAGAVAAALALSAGALASDAWTGETATGTVDGLVRDVDGELLRTDEGLPYTNAWGTDTSPLIDLGDPGAAAVIAALAPRDRALPTWITWDDVVASVVAQTSDGAGVTSADGLRTNLLFGAAHAWQVSWLEAWARGDDDDVARAFAGWSSALEETEPVWDPESWRGRERLIEQVRAGDQVAMLYDAEVDNPWVGRTGADGDPRTVDDLRAVPGAART